jgi:hypothetical protein
MLYPRIPPEEVKETTNKLSHNNSSSVKILIFLYSSWEYAGVVKVNKP